MEKKDMHLALISPSKSSYSETFIKAHLDNLDFAMYHYHGNDTYFPVYLNSEVLKSTPFLMIKHFILRLLGFFFKTNVQPSFYTLKQKDNLLNSFKKNKIEAVLAEYGPTGALCTEICKQNNLPLIVHFHGLDANIYSLLDKYSDLYQKMFEYATYIIVVSNDMYNKLIELGAPKHKLFLNTCGPNDDFFKVTNSFNSRQFLSVGRFVDKKAPYLTIMAFKKVLVNYPDATLKMIGDGPLLNTCINLVKSSNIEKSIIFSGKKTSNEVQREMALSCGYVQHSITALNGDKEGAPVGIIEASASGLPVISTRHAGIPDIVVDGKTGFLVDELDVDAMAQAMNQVLESPTDAKLMGLAGREYIKKNFSMQKHISNLNKLVYAVLQK